MKLILRTGAFPVSFLEKLQGQTGLGAEVRQEWAAKCAEVSVFNLVANGTLNQRKNVCVPEGCDDGSKEDGLQGGKQGSEESTRDKDFSEEFVESDPSQGAIIVESSHSVWLRQRQSSC